MIEYENLFKVNISFQNGFQNAFAEVLRSGRYILGKHVQQFELEFANFCNVNFCVGVGSGLDALVLSFKALGLPAGSEVIVPANTYIATILSVIHAGLQPVLVEPNIHTYNIDPNLIEERITPSTKAILVAHLYGKPCEMDAILNICNKYQLFLVEDCAQAHGAKFGSNCVGTFGDLGAFSFYPTKNLGALGDGGAVLTKETTYAEKINKLRNYGSGQKYYNDYIGLNSRLDELQAAILSIKLKRLEEINSHKRKLAKIYGEGLKEEFIKPSSSENSFDVFHIYPIRHDKRDLLREYLSANEIGTEVHYPIPPYKQKALQEIFRNKTFPISDQIHSTILSLPISFGHSEEEIERVVEVMNRF